MNIHLSSRIETYVKYLSTDNQYLNDVKWICKSFMDDVKTSDNKWAKSKEISIAIEFLCDSNVHYFIIVYDKCLNPICSPNDGL